MRFNTNVQNICKLHSFIIKLHIITMRNLFLLFLFVFTFFSCEKNDTEDLLPDYSVNVDIDLGLSSYINLNTPSGWAYTIPQGFEGGIKGIWIQNTGIGTPPYKAFERACPNNDCVTPMEFDESFRLKCLCDDSTYSILNGSPQTEGSKQYAREYRVIQTSSTKLKITSF